jgi:hypothetical protein
MFWETAMAETLQGRQKLAELQKGDHFCAGSQYWLVTDMRQEVKGLRLCVNQVTGVAKWFIETEVVEYYA